MRSKSVFRGFGPSNRVRIEIPIDPILGTVAQRARRATIWLLARGVYPSPSAVNMRMRGTTRDCLNGIETRERNRVLRERGIPHQRRKRADGQWSPPE